ncbi:MAG TPA: hypothetical protein VEW68_04245 [Patescibacteria group bacterium]|nr:hypothetical protein [Patescibacteria group bacterium]
MSPSHGLLARIQRADADSLKRYGPHTPEVEAFIASVARLTPAQWDQVAAAGRMVASVTKEGGDEPAESARSIRSAIKGRDTRISEPMARAGEALFAALSLKSQVKQVAAWQALTALVMRSHLPPLKFAVSYAAFAGVIPPWGFDVLDIKSAGFIRRLENLSAAEAEILAARWRVDSGASRALLQALAKNRHPKSEEAAAIAALRVVPAYITGDQGWAAVRTAAHGGRVLASVARLTAAEVADLWAPLEPAVPYESLEEAAQLPPARGDAIKRQLKVVIPEPEVAREAPPARAKPAGQFGPASADVAAFIKGLAQLTPIQWLRVLDRRKLVASVTREGTAEPAGVVRSILAAIEGTRELDMPTRGRAFAAVERAGFALEGRARLSPAQVDEMYRPFASLIPMDGGHGSAFAARLAALLPAEWEEVAAAAPPASEDAVSPLVNAGSALKEVLRGRSDDEVVAAWHACSALVQRHHLTPIKFAASYAPFASAVPVTRTKSLSAMAVRYVSALGRLGAAQCAILAQPWQVDDELSNALSKAAADGSTRPAEEAAALAAVVTVPMRLVGSGGWAAVKTAAFGGRVIASKSRLTSRQLGHLWEPLQAAIPLASLEAPPKSRR